MMMMMMMFTEDYKKSHNLVYMSYVKHVNPVKGISNEHKNSKHLCNNLIVIQVIQKCKAPIAGFPIALYVMEVRIYIYMYMYIYLYKHIYIHIYVYRHICMYLCVYVNLYIYIDIFKHI
jgi:hypothetical protein